MKLIWEILAWLSMICALAAYTVGWIALMSKTEIWIPTGYWFYDAITAGIFGVFFVLYGTLAKKR